MSDVIGPRLIPEQQYGFSTSFSNTALAKKVDDEIDRILDEQYQRGRLILLENRPILDAIAQMLLEEETIDGSEIDKIIK